MKKIFFKLLLASSIVGGACLVVGCSSTDHRTSVYVSSYGYGYPRYYGYYGRPVYYYNRHYHISPPNKPRPGRPIQLPARRPGIKPPGNNIGRPMPARPATRPAPRSAPRPRRR